MLAGVSACELFAVIAEGLWYQAWLHPGLLRAMGWSLVANACSFGLGCVLQWA